MMISNESLELGMWNMEVFRS